MANKSFFSKLLLLSTWIILMVLVAYPISIIVSIIYVLMQPFQACGLLNQVMNALFEKCVMLPIICAENAYNAKSLF